MTAGDSIKKDIKKAMKTGVSLEVMEKELFLIASGGILFVMSINMGVDLYFGLGKTTMPTHLTAFVLVLILMILAIKNKAYPVCYTILCFLLGVFVLPFSFITGGGFESGIPVYMVMAFFACGCHIDKAMRYIAGGVSLFTALTVCLLSLSFPDLVTPLPEELVVPEIIMAIVLSAILITVVASLFLNNCQIAYEKNLKDYEQKTVMRMSLLESQVENIKDIKRQRHNMRHHNQIIKEFAEKGDMKGLRHYLQEKQYSEEFYSKKFYCMNTDINNILTVYAKMAESKGIALDIKSDVKSAINIEKKDLMNMISTIVENAINGTVTSGREEDRRVELELKEKGHRLVVKCTNSCADGIEEVEMLPGFPGVGIEETKDKLDDYGGVLNYEIKDGKVNCCLIVDAF